METTRALIEYEVSFCVEDYERNLIGTQIFKCACSNSSLQFVPVSSQ